MWLLFKHTNLYNIAFLLQIIISNRLIARASHQDPQPGIALDSDWPDCGRMRQLGPSFVTYFVRTPRITLFTPLFLHTHKTSNELYNCCQLFWLWNHSLNASLLFFPSSIRKQSAHFNLPTRYLKKNRSNCNYPITIPWRRLVWSSRK